MMQVGLVRQVNINEEMRESYLDYAMSVIVARALPDARDGFKPVHRRILYAMYDMGLRPDSSHKKSARIVGEVLGKYHPHGDSSVYDAMARLAQDFSMRYELVDGQGNFGSIDGDAPAAMRYTEARMTFAGFDLLTDIDKDTVDFGDNFDGSLQEPTVLPAAVPNLLVNGSSGIAVGMSTSIPPHNMNEVCDALIYMLESWDRLDDVDTLDLMRFIKGPDFPTGGVIYRQEAKGEEDMLVAAYATGRSKLTVRAKAHIENLGRGRTRIIISEIPFQTNKNSLIERIADLVRDGRIEGISDLRDESDRQGLRIVIEVKSGTLPTDVLADLFKYTPLEDTFSVIMLALVDGEPRTLSLKQALRVYLDHRLTVVRRRSEFDLARARDRAHILQGLLVALDKLNTVIKLIRESPNAEIARAALMERLNLSEVQANAILEMQLRRLAALERQKIEDEFTEKRTMIAHLEGLLASEIAMRKVIADELSAVKTRYGDARRSVIVDGPAGNISAGELLAHDAQTWVTLTASGKLSRTHADAVPPFNADGPRFAVPGSTADILYVVTTNGEAQTIPVQQLPQTDDPAAGGELSSLLPIKTSEEIAGLISLSPLHTDGYLIFTTVGGEVKRIRIEDLPGMSAHTFTVMNVGSDRIATVHYVTENDEIVLISAQAQAIRFRVSEVRPTGLPAGGMRGIKLAEQDDRVVGSGIIREAITEAARNALLVWTITGSGMAKASPISEYPLQGRAGSGVATMKLPFLDEADGLIRTGKKDVLVAGLVGAADHTVIVLTLRKKLKIMPIKKTFLAARGKPGGALMGSMLGKTDRVVAAALIAPRPPAEAPLISPPPEVRPEVHTNGTSGQTHQK